MTTFSLSSGKSTSVHKEDLDARKKNVRIAYETKIFWGSFFSPEEKSCVGVGVLYVVLYDNSNSKSTAR